MTDRVKGLVVTLGRPNREDDVSRLVDAISMFEGVVSVKAVTDGVDDHINRQMVMNEMREKLWKALE